MVFTTETVSNLIYGMETKVKLYYSLYQNKVGRKILQRRQFFESFRNIFFQILICLFVGFLFIYFCCCYIAEGIGYVKCSAQLFPHLVYVCELTTDFVDRAVGSIKLPKTWSSLKIMKKKFHVIIKSKSLPIHPVNSNQGEYFLLKDHYLHFKLSFWQIQCYPMIMM